MSSQTGTFTIEEVAKHNIKDDLFLLVHGKVYDCSSFISKHPGGEDVLLEFGGRDATEAFEDIGHSDEARELLDKLKIGNVELPGNEPTNIHPSTDVLDGVKGTFKFWEWPGTIAIVILSIAAIFVLNIRIN